MYAQNKILSFEQQNAHQANSARCALSILYIECIGKFYSHRCLNLLLILYTIRSRIFLTLLLINVWPFNLEANFGLVA